MRKAACAVLVALVLFAWRGLSAQTGVVTGTVVGDSTGRALPGATITLPQLKRSITTNYLGEFRFRELPAGTYRIEIRHLGYALLLDSVSVREGQVVDREYELRAQPLTLDSMKVTATSGMRASPFLDEFDARRKQGFGHFIDDSLLRRDGDGRTSFANFLVGHLPGLSVVQKKVIGQPTYLSSGRGQCSGPIFTCATSSACMPALYVDGNVVYAPGRQGLAPPDLDQYRAEDYAAIEWYQGGATTPPQFNATGSNCGVLLLWRRYR